MFEFFLALFGGIYYGGRLLSENSSDRKYDRKIRDREALRENIRQKYCFDYYKEREIKKYILSGAHLDEICEEFHEDFEYALGEDWRNKINLPPNPRLLYVKSSLDDIPDNHIYWVYRLILASQGKVERWMLWDGYQLASMDNRQMSIKFAEAIEHRLIKAGVSEIRFVYVNDCSAGHTMQVESLCYQQHQRLW